MRSELISSYTWAFEEIEGCHKRHGIMQKFEPLIKFFSFLWFVSISIVFSLYFMIIEFFNDINNNKNRKTQE